MKKALITGITGQDGSYLARITSYNVCYTKLLRISFAILILNGFTPLINAYVKPKRFGGKK